MSRKRTRETFLKKLNYSFDYCFSITDNLNITKPKLPSRSRKNRKFSRYLFNREDYPQNLQHFGFPCSKLLNKLNQENCNSENVILLELNLKFKEKIQKPCCNNTRRVNRSRILGERPSVPHLKSP